MKRLVRRRVVVATGLFLVVASAALALVTGGGWSGGAYAQDAVPTPFVITATPTPADVFAAATSAALQTAQAATTGTATPLPPSWVLATATLTPRVVTATPTAENDATATVMAAQATAIAFTTGTPPPNLLVVTATPTPAPTWVTPAPPPADVVAQAALAAASTRQAAAVGTPTPTPTNWRVARAVVVPNLQVAANAATAAALAEQATAIAFLNQGPGVVLWTATPPPRPTATPLYIYLSDVTPTPVAEGVPFPPELVGKIVFLSNVLSGNRQRPDAFVMNPDGTGLAKLTSREFYDRAKAREVYSPDRRYRAFAETEQGGSKRTQIFYNDAEYGTVKQLTFYGAGVAWDPAWSPVEDLAAFVATESNGDEIWTARIGQNPADRLTRNTWEWDKSPSFSPDGQQIIFMSNRTGRQQLWIMDKDGSNQRPFVEFEFEAWDPVWVKYADS